MQKDIKLCIIIPVYNEKHTILQSLQRVQAIDFGMNYEIIIIDDGSTDGTCDILKKLSRSGLDSNVKIIFKSKNQGKGAALRKGFETATGKIIAIQDADLEYDPGDLPKLIAPILKGETHIVYGSRFSLSYDPGRHRLHYWGNCFISFLFRLLYRTNITDAATCYKVFKRSILDSIPPLQLNGFEMESEFTAKVLRAGYTILELPIKYQPRSFVEGKKITWRHAIIYIWTIIKHRFTND